MIDTTDRRTASMSETYINRYDDEISDLSIEVGMVLDESESKYISCPSRNVQLNIVYEDI